MNDSNLHELINRYESNYHLANNTEHNEIFKWKAVKQFRDVWFSDEYKDKPFSVMFNEAKKECSFLIDNSQVSPTNGIVKLAERQPKQVERLFRDVLFAESESVSTVQDHMEQFLCEIEKIRVAEFPQCWKYKQDRHAASCYLSFFAPDKHYMYRFSEAEEFAKYIEFGKDIGFGENFRLDYYYEMADMVVEALKQYDSLLALYRTLISDTNAYYQDDSLHLMAFDLMYCCRAYNYYAGLEHTSKKESLKAFTLQQIRDNEQKERESAIAAIEDEIHSLEIQLEPYESISLVNVTVNQTTYGIGVITKQNKNMITVQFSQIEKTFQIHKKFSMRPTFENDKEIVDAFTEYTEISEKIKQLQAQLKRLL